MERNRIYNDLIEKYLDGSLSREEKDEVDQQLATNTELSERLSERILVQQTWMKVTQHEQIKQHIKEVIDHDQRKIWSGKKWLAAASIIMLLGFSSVFFIRYNQIRNAGELIAGNKKGMIISGQKNEIKKYGSIDNIKSNSDELKFMPMDGMNFSKTDTIKFSWPMDSHKNRLVLFDENWIKVADIELITNVSEFILIPGKLKPGSYTWILTPNALKRKFSIN